MITLETTITHTEKRTLNIPAPSFWKEPTTAYDCYRAVLDEKTYIQVMRLWNGDIVDIEHSTVERRSANVLQAQENWSIISEQEFMQMYDDAWECMRLRPVLA